MSIQTCVSCGFAQQNPFRYCPACGFDHNTPLICPDCKYQNEFNSKFCQECGRSLRPIHAPDLQVESILQKPSILIEPAPKDGITIEFHFSTAQSFEFAVAEARKQVSFKQFGEDKKAVYRITVQAKELAGVIDLLEHLKGWRKKFVYVNGDKVPWENVFAFEWCYRKKLASFKPDLYCFGYENEWEANIWGCIQAHLSCEENAPWFKWGKWLNNKGEWQFDKERIMHELQKSLFSVRFCPALRTDFIERIINALPETVNPNKDAKWRFLESFGSEDENGIVVTRTKYGFEERVILVGVYPASREFLTELRDSIKRQILG